MAQVTSITTALVVSTFTTCVLGLSLIIYPSLTLLIALILCLAAAGISWTNYLTGPVKEEKMSWIPTVPNPPSIPDWFNQIQQAQQANMTPAAQNQFINSVMQAQTTSTWHANKETINVRAMELLHARLNGVDGNFIVGERNTIYTHVHDATDRVYVFFAVGEKAGYLEDEKAIFPSDRLVTQIRLLWNV
jgi:hypothetical protein